MDYFWGKQLKIQSNFSHSDNRIKDYVKILDDLCILSSGHYTREQDILLRLFCSCGPNEEATPQCYNTEVQEFAEMNKLILVYSNKKVSSRQITKYDV